jgi:hypothetical protein
MNLKHCGGFNT